MRNKPSRHKQSKKASFKKRQLQKSSQSKQIVHSQVLKYHNESYKLSRYPITDDPSLRAWSAAEILAVDYIKEAGLLTKVDVVHLYNDRFGVWSCLLNKQNTLSIITHASQYKAVNLNVKANTYSTDIRVEKPLSKLQKVELVLIKVPKSIELFELFLQQIHQASNESTQVICCFMTKYFASSMLKVASKYFEQLEQSQAWKKARLLILKKPNSNVKYSKITNQILFKDKRYQQYFGVFSADRIDMGTQFLLAQYQEQKLMVKTKELKILDLACGNGVIAHELAKYNKDADFTLLDDFQLAIESAKINLEGIQSRFICDDNLDALVDDEFDLVVSNPPFHFEHENNIEVALSLFTDVKRVLKDGGRFVLVANKHLNYSTHLSELFNKVFVVATNEKFEIYECLK